MAIICKANEMGQVEVKVVLGFVQVRGCPITNVCHATKEVDGGGDRALGRI